ncbi:hypothetical protein [Flavobacterium sp.]|uniref:hypothetical protein n=1 Tax=Flavobacterium sp. TaxID=239 RepID=UPI00262D786D|nr:hypothetical protein [Flavobacterium sp.]
MERIVKTDHRKNNLNTVFRVILVLLMVAFNIKSFGQKNAKDEIILPIEVKAAFEKQYPNSKASWTREYRGDNDDQLRYEAKFKGTKGNDLAVYDNLGNLKAFEASITLRDLPANATKYLKKGNFLNKVTEAVKVTDMDIHPDSDIDLNIKKMITYEVGVVKGSQFYDLVFSDKGAFIRMVEKD